MTLEVIVTVLLLAGAIGLGVAVFVWTRNWRRQLNEEPTIETQIESYRTMLDEGVIDDDEYDRIVAQLEGRSVAPETGIHPGPPPEGGTPEGGTPRPTDFRPGLPPQGGAPDGGTPPPGSAS